MQDLAEVFSWLSLELNLINSTRVGHKLLMDDNEFEYEELEEKITSIVLEYKFDSVLEYLINISYILYLTKNRPNNYWL